MEKLKEEFSRFEETVRSIMPDSRDSERLRTMVCTFIITQN